MKCVLCRSGSTSPGSASLTIEVDQTAIIVRDVPAEVCTQCGEAYFDVPTVAAAERQAAEARRLGVTVALLEYQVA